MLQLLSKHLMERERTGLRPAVRSHLAQRDETGHTGDGDDVAVVFGDHVRDELLGHPVVGEGVYFVGLADVLFGFVEDGAFEGDAGIVDEDGWAGVLRADQVGGLLESCAGCDVGLVEVGVGGCFRGLIIYVISHNYRGVRFGLTQVISRLLHIQNHNPHALGLLIPGQVHHDLLADSAAPAGDQNQLLLRSELADGGPVVLRPLV